MLLVYLLAITLVGLIAYQWASVSFSIGGSIGNAQLSGTITREEVGSLSFDPLLPAAQAGTLTTRTDDNTGVITLDDSAVPTVTTSDLVTLVWADGERHGVTITAVGANTIDIDTGSGDVLPIATTAITVCKEIALDVNILGTNVAMFGYSCPTESYIDVQEVSGTAPSTNPLTVPAGEGYFWWESGPITNPFATVNIGSIRLANYSTESTAQAYVGILYDAD